MAKMKKINFKSKKTWKNILVIGLACITLVGAIVGLSALFRKSEETTKVINPTYAVGGLTEDGKYKETEESIYTEDAFECQGLDIELDFKSNISYRVFFYGVDGDFVNATAKQTGNFDDVPSFAKTCRIVITPNEDEEIKWYEKNGYANQLTIRVDEEQNFVDPSSIDCFAIDPNGLHIYYNEDDNFAIVERGEGGTSKMFSVDGFSSVSVEFVSGNTSAYRLYWLDADGNFVGFTPLVTDNGADYDVPSNAVNCRMFYGYDDCIYTIYRNV